MAKQVNASREMPDLATADYVFTSHFGHDEYAVIVHQHEGGSVMHYDHEPTHWGDRWIYGLIHGDIHYHETRIGGGS